jgi:hypothetical protein
MHPAKEFANLDLECAAISIGPMKTWFASGSTVHVDSVFVFSSVYPLLEWRARGLHFMGLVRRADKELWVAYMEMKAVSYGRGATKPRGGADISSHHVFPCLTGGRVSVCTPAGIYSAVPGACMASTTNRWLCSAKKTTRCCPQCSCPKSEIVALSYVSKILFHICLCSLRILLWLNLWLIEFIYILSHMCSYCIR